MSYVKTVWQDLPDRTTPITAARLNNLETQYDKALGALGVFNAAVDEAGTWTQNRDAIQAAIDAAVAAGGGTVRIPPGRFQAKGVVLDSRVHLDGADALIVDPDGDGVDVIRTRVRTTTGTLSAGVLTVDSATGVEPGVMVSVRGAGGISPWQSTTLTGDITNVQTAGIILADVTGFASAGLLQVGSELISYTGLSGAELTGVTRGMYGTTAAAHSAAAVIGVALRMLTTVDSVDGTTVNLDPSIVADIDVSAAPVSIGSIGARVDVNIFGNRVVGGATASHYSVRGELARLCQFRVNADRAESALYLDAAWDNEYDVSARDCSVPEGSKGSAVWLFRQCHRNTGVSRISGDTWAGVYLDNRTSLATDTDGACNDNSGVVILDVLPRTPWITNTGLLIVGGNRNHFVLQGAGVRTGLLIESDSQAYTHNGVYPEARGNRVDVAITGVYQPWVLLDAGNVITGYYESATNGDNTGGSLVALASTSPGGSPSLGNFADGAQSAPSIAFASDTGTGFYRITAGAVQFVSAGALVARFRSSGILLTDGKDLEIGITTGSKIGVGATAKIGFWGATPVVQPAAVADATDAASAITQLNALLARMRAIGLITT